MVAAADLRNAVIGEQASKSSEMRIVLCPDDPRLLRLPPDIQKIASELFQAGLTLDEALRKISSKS